MSLASERATLVRALSSVAVLRRRRRIRRFLEGLSAHELEYIAGYLGACLIESNLPQRPAPRADIAWEVLRYEGFPATPECSPRRPERRASSLLEHRMILLLEYLHSCHEAAMPVTASTA